jgi:hypothetical protein
MFPLAFPRGTSGQLLKVSAPKKPDEPSGNVASQPDHLERRFKQRRNLYSDDWRYS